MHKVNVSSHTRRHIFRFGVAIILLALNQRPAVTSVGSLIPNMIEHHVPRAVVDMAVALPTWGFAVGGWIMPVARRRCGGTSRAISGAIVGLVASLACRVAGGSESLLVGTAAASLAIGVIGAALPGIMRTIPAEFRAIIGAGYVTAVGLGSTIGALLTPMVASGTSWKISMGSWALLGGVAAIAWFCTVGRPTTTAPDSSNVLNDGAYLKLRTVMRYDLAWTLTVHFGLMSTVTVGMMGWMPEILRDAGVSTEGTEIAFGTAMILGLPISLVVPRLASHGSRQMWTVLALTASSIIGVTGLLVAPALAPTLWASFVGIGMGTLALTLVALTRRADPGLTTPLSSMVQGFGYLFTGLALLAIGAIHAATGMWGWPISLLLIVLIAQGVTGVMYSRSPLVISGTTDLASATIDRDATG